jgi:hypothetical protein
MVYVSVWVLIIYRDGWIDRKNTGRFFLFMNGRKESERESESV